MLFIMRGTSCSGKDTFINDHFPDRLNVLSSDDFRQMMYGSVHEQRHNDKVFKTMYEIMELRFQHKAEWTVLNSTNLRIRDIQKPIELCKKYHVPFTILSIQPPELEELKRRNNQRSLETGFFVPENVLERHRDRYFNALEPFIQEAANNIHCTLIEVDQDEKVLKHVYCYD